MDEPSEPNGSKQTAGDCQTLADAPKSLLATVWMALRGDRVDLNTAPLGSAVILMAVPMVLEMIMESVFTVVDIFFVSKLFRGNAAIVPFESVRSVRST